MKYTIVWPTRRLRPSHQVNVCVSTLRPEIPEWLTHRGNMEIHGLALEAPTLEIAGKRAPRKRKVAV